MCPYAVSKGERRFNVEFSQTNYSMLSLPTGYEDKTSGYYENVPVYNSNNGNVRQKKFHAFRGTVLMGERDYYETKALAGVHLDEGVKTITAMLSGKDMQNFDMPYLYIFGVAYAWDHQYGGGQVHDMYGNWLNKDGSVVYRRAINTMISEKTCSWSF